jgi:hypothetical protein
MLCETHIVEHILNKMKRFHNQSFPNNDTSAPKNSIAAYKILSYFSLVAKSQILSFPAEGIISLRKIAWQALGCVLAWIERGEEIKYLI